MIREAVPEQATFGGVKPALVLNSGFIFTGMVTTLLGPLLPVFIARWNLSDTQAGYFFTAQFLASVSITLASTAIISRIGFRQTLIWGYGVMTAGIATLAIAQWPGALYCTFVYGIGLGLAIPATNLFVAAAAGQHAGKKSSALNVVNFFWGAGAVTLPALLAAAGPRHATQVLTGLAAALALLTVSFFGFPATPEAGIAPPRRGATTAGVLAQEQGFASAGATAPLRGEGFAILAMLAIGFLFYVGAENALGGWIASFARQDVIMKSGWALTPAFFWAGLLASRASAPALLRRFPERRLAQTGILLACAGAVSLLAAKGIAAICLAGFLTGFGMGPVYPSLITALTSLPGDRGFRFAGPIFAVGGLGGASLPLLVGIISTRWGALRFGLVAPLAALLILFAIYSSTTQPRRPA